MTIAFRWFIKPKGLLGELYALNKSRVFKSIPSACGSRHVMPTCMNIFYRIADPPGFVMVRSVDCERTLFSLKNVVKNAK